MRKMRKGSGKRILALLLAVMLLCPTTGVDVSASADDTSETMPDVYFDLEFADGEIEAEGTNKANTKIDKYGNGKVETMSVLYEGQICEIPVYSADKFTSGSSHSYLGVKFTDVEDLDDMKSWIFNNGITFECFVYVENTPTATCGIMSDMWSGGIGLYNRVANTTYKNGEVNFNMGTTNKDGVKYYITNDNKSTGTITYATAYPSFLQGDWQEGTDAYKKSRETYALDAGKLTHLVGTYDSSSNTLALYKNGELVSSGTYSSGRAGDFNLNKALAGQFGLGANLPYAANGEWMDALTAYSIADARVYSGSLSADQVSQQYANRWNDMLAYATVGYDEVTQLDDLREYASLDATGRSQALTDSGLPAYIYGSETIGSYAGNKAGESSNPGTSDLMTYVFSETSNGAYLSYLKSLEADGWERYSNNIIDGKNLFATYTKEGKSVYAYYIANKSQTYIIASENCILENRAADNQYTEVCDTLFTQINATGVENSYGMSYVLRLADGRFIIIDGGWNENDLQAEKLYGILEKQNVLEKPTIAAWIITHPHGDHLGASCDFFKLYDQNDVVIEEMIFNYPTWEDTAAVESNSVDETIEGADSRLPYFWKNMKQYWPNMKIVTCHTGQEYYFADAKLEILHTIEDYYPNSVRDLSKLNINGASVVFTIEVAGQKNLILGDASPEEADNLVAMWGDYLKSDIMQMAHHAMEGGSVELYELVDPAVVTIPAPRPWIDEPKHSRWNYDTTRWVLNNVGGKIKEVIYAGFGTRSIELPYTPADDVEYFSNRNQNGYDFDEADKKEATIPEPYMDLQFDGNSVKDGGTADNTLTMNGGSVGTNTVYYNGKVYDVTSYRAEKSTTDYGHINVTMNDLKAKEDLKNLILDGCTFEMFVALDTPPEGFAGLLGSVHSGGVVLYLRNDTGVTTFQVGNSSNTGTYSNGNYASAIKMDLENVGNIVTGKNVAHVVGTYNPETNMLRVYQNGVLISEGKYSDDNNKDAFKYANGDHASFNELGIGMNACYPSEAVAAQTGYTVIRSRVYDECLDENQVAAEYWNCIAELTGDETVKHDWKDQAEFDWNDDYSVCTATKECANGGCTETLPGTVVLSSTNEAYKATATFADGTSYEDSVTRYAITVIDGTASKTYAAAGESITLTPGTAPSGQQFKEWTSSVTIQNNAFTMPASAVSISASWCPIPQAVPDNVKDINADNVKLSDKENLEDALEVLEDDLETNGSTYTADEKKALEDAIDTIEAALESIDDVEKVEAKLNALPATVTKADEATIDAAAADYNALSTHEKTLISENAVKKLDDAKAALDKLLTSAEKAEKVEKQLNALPTTVTKVDEATIKAAETAYNALSADEKAMVSADAVKKLNDAKAALVALNESSKEDNSNTQTESSDDNTVQTGDTTQPVVMLLLVLGSAMVIMMMVSKKRRSRA